MKHQQLIKDSSDADKTEAVRMYHARRRFRGVMMSAVVAGQVSLVWLAATSVFSTTMAVITACSALGWCVYSLFLDDTAVKMFNTKEYFRVLLNAATLQLERAEFEGFILQKNSQDEGTPSDDSDLKEDSSDEEAT